VSEVSLSRVFERQNQLDNEVNYRLVIQRSTGRFSESYQNVSDKVPFSQRNGRCVKVSPTR